MSRIVGFEGHAPPNRSVIAWMRVLSVGREFARCRSQSEASLKPATSLKKGCLETLTDLICVMTECLNYNSGLHKKRTD